MCTKIRGKLLKKKKWRPGVNLVCLIPNAIAPKIQLFNAHVITARDMRVFFLVLGLYQVSVNNMLYSLATINVNKAYAFMLVQHVCDLAPDYSHQSIYAFSFYQLVPRN